MEPFVLAKGPPVPVDVIVIATPVRQIQTVFERIKGWVSSDTAITDVGSTKRATILAEEEAGCGRQFVGSHPMAGSHTSGWSASTGALFFEAKVWLCPTRKTEDWCLKRITNMWEYVGAKPEVVDSEKHDKMLAYVSHLPQVLASGLAGTLEKESFSRSVMGLGGRDMTRLAGSDVDMWMDVIMDNSKSIGEALAALLLELINLHSAIENKKEGQIRKALERGKNWKETEGKI